MLSSLITHVHKTIQHSSYPLFFICFVCSIATSNDDVTKIVVNCFSSHYFIVAGNNQVDYISNNKLLAHGAKLFVNHVNDNAILHHFWFSCDFDLLMTKEVKNWVKARSKTWYSNFFMNQYDNQWWVEHFHVTKKVVLQITKKL